MVNITSTTVIPAVDSQVKNGLRHYSKHRDYALNIFVLTYVVVGYAASLWELTSPLWWHNILAFILLVHTLTLAGFFLHEFIHHNIFSLRKLNVIGGEVMLFLTGSCYSRFRDLAPHHIAHHVHGADFSPFYPFSLSDFLRSLPRPIMTIITVLEWFCIPAIALMFRWMIAIAPFLASNRRDECWRNAALLSLRGTICVGFALYSLKLICLYFLAYVCWLNILQFTEGFQHTYSAYRIQGEVPKYQLEEDEANTYSLRLPYGLAWLGPVLFLNNNYHNAHHRVMSCPWYLIPQLNSELYGETDAPSLPLFPLLQNYFRYRIRRLFDGQGYVERTESEMDCSHFLGASGMSFMLLRQPFDWLNCSSWLS